MVITSSTVEMEPRHLRPPRRNGTNYWRLFEEIGGICSGSVVGASRDSRFLMGGLHLGKPNPDGRSALPPERSVCEMVELVPLPPHLFLR